MYDILGRYNKTQEAANFYYQVQPTNGYYCIYRKRPNESGVVPDCPNIPQTLQK